MHPRPSLTSRLRASSAAWEAILRTQVVLMRGFEAAGDFAPLTSREYDVLFNLAGAGGRLPMRELVDSALVTQPSMSRMVDRLAEADLVRRAPHPGDGRAVLVELTPTGEAMQKQIGRRHVRSIADALSPLSDAELDVLASLCSQLHSPAAPAPEFTPTL